jgi:hypothetical protein
LCDEAPTTLPGLRSQGSADGNPTGRSVRAEIDDVLRSRASLCDQQHLLIFLQKVDDVQQTQLPYFVKFDPVQFD